MRQTADLIYGGSNPSLGLKGFTLIFLIDFLFILEKSSHLHSDDGLIFLNVSFDIILQILY